MRLIWATSCDEKWYPKVEPYLVSLSRHWRHEAYLICVGWEPPAENLRVPNIRYVRMDIPPGSITKHGSIQHGAFTQAIDGVCDDVFIFTDGDVFMQRGATEKEVEWLWFWAEDGEYHHLDKIGMCHSMSTMGTTLEQQVRHNMQPEVSFEELADVFPGYENLISYAAGCVIGRRSSFETLYERFLEWARDAEKCFGHHSRTQWLMSYLLQTEGGLGVVEIPYEFHVANLRHPMLPAGSHFVDGNVYYNGTMCLLRHGFGWQKTLAHWREHKPECVR